MNENSLYDRLEKIYDMVADNYIMKKIALLMVDGEYMHFEDALVFYGYISLSAIIAISIF